MSTKHEPLPSSQNDLSTQLSTANGGAPPLARLAGAIPAGVSVGAALDSFIAHANSAQLNREEWGLTRRSRPDTAKPEDRAPDPSQRQTTLQARVEILEKKLQAAEEALAARAAATAVEPANDEPPIDQSIGYSRK